MPTKESISRKEFLMKLGLSGSALFAAMTSCVNKDDMTVDALTISGKSGTTTGTTTSGTTTGTTTSGTTTGTTTSGTTTGTTTTSTNAAPTTYRLMLNLNSYSALSKTGGYVVLSGIVVALVAAGKYAAVTQTCSHEPKKKIIYSGGEFFCTDHGARYTNAGVGLNSLGARGIAAYKTTLVGNILYVL